MDKFLAMVEKFNGMINGWVWGPVMLVFLVGTGIILTFGLKFFQVGKIGLWMKNTFGTLFKKSEKVDKDSKAISAFQALCTALGGTVGVGNVVGVTTAIAIGGPGAVFWMWVAAFFGMMTKYSEIVLGLYYRQKNADGEWNGGAMYYLKEGFSGKKGLATLGKVLGVLFAIFCIMASFGIGNMSQINTIAANMEQVFHINIWVTGIILLVLMAICALGGLKRIASVTEKFVPFMAIFYIIGSVIILIMQADQIGPVFAAIFKGAFGGYAIAGGLVGSVITMGFKRGVFSNEAGLGSSALVHSAADTKEPAKQGMWGVFEVFVDTIIICTLSALVILSSGVINLDTGLVSEAYAGIKDSVLVTEAFKNSFGVYGEYFAAIAIFFFAFSTILSWNFFGKINVQYLFKNKKWATVAYSVIAVAFIFLGSVLKNDLVWELTDFFNYLMVIPNVIALAALGKLVKKNALEKMNKEDK